MFMPTKFPFPHNHFGLLDPFDRNSFRDHLFDKYAKPERGSVLVCDISPFPGLSLMNLNLDHTGIYGGNGQIIHRNGDGRIEKVGPEEFLERLDGKNFAMTIYVASKGKRAIANQDAFRRAKAALEDENQSGYDLLNKNCHHFTRYCLTGDTDQWGLDCTFSSLQSLLAHSFGMDGWRIWNFRQTSA